MFLDKRYQLQDPIVRNSNGMSTVYRGHDDYMKRNVAIKVMRDIYSSNTELVTRFQHQAHEAKARSVLQHPNIVQIYDYGQADGKYYVVMELIEGTDLRRYLRSRKILAVDRTLTIAHDIALGLGAAHHRGIVHRSVNPQHVLIGRDGSIKLTAFSMLWGPSAHYYAPEQLQGEVLTPATDVYALGVVMYEMLAGHTPFDADTPVAVAMQHIHDTPVPPRQFNPDIPPALEQIILRCLEKAPERRYENGSQLAYALKMPSET